MAEQEDPIVQALPPATDYLTYLTILGYQLTPARLPILHRLLQDEVLTTHIGWDLVQILLPMLPESQLCLHDVARLGNPREVILRVSDALMGLQPQDLDESEEAESKHDPEDESQLGTNMANISAAGENYSTRDKKFLPLYIIQFTSLVSMLSVLHSRIKTKYPSRFIATSLQAALEAYSSMPTGETTIAFLDFLRELSPNKRPALPPRGISGLPVVPASEASAPDPEAETYPSSLDEEELVQKLLQFGLVELLKLYMLNLSDSTDLGMAWTLRVQKKLQLQTGITWDPSKTSTLIGRDMVIGRITALSRDLCLKEGDLLRIVSQPTEKQPPPLDFEELPRSADEIPLEKHGSLLLLTARLSMTILYGNQGSAVRIPVFPDLANVFFKFIGNHRSPDGLRLGQPHILLDSLLTLATVSISQPIEITGDHQQYEDFILTLTACTSRQSYNSIRRIPSVVVHSHPSPMIRFKLIQKVFENEDLLYAKESAIEWLKVEILSTTGSKTNTKITAISSTEPSIFVDQHYFLVLFTLLFDPAVLSLNTSSDIVSSWLEFTQTLAPMIHAALNLYYIFISSKEIRECLALQKTYVYFRQKFLTPLKSLCHEFEADWTETGGRGQIEAAVGENMRHLGMMRSVGLISNVITQLENVLFDLCEQDETATTELTAEDTARIAEIRLMAKS